MVALKVWWSLDSEYLDLNPSSFDYLQCELGSELVVPPLLIEDNTSLSVFPSMK
jgi:hypothetical protein